MLKTLAQNTKVLFALVLLAVLAFAWYEWRPSEIRKECWAEARQVLIDVGKFNLEEVNNLRMVYEGCLHRRGLAE